MAERSFNQNANLVRSTVRPFRFSATVLTCEDRESAHRLLGQHNKQASSFLLLQQHFKTGLVAFSFESFMQFEYSVQNFLKVTGNFKNEFVSVVLLGRVVRHLYDNVILTDELLFKM